MKTTTLIIEIVVIGFTALIWIFLFILGFSDKNIASLIDLCKTYHDIFPILVLFMTAIAYQIGWLLDHWSYKWFYYGWKSLLRISKIDDEDENQKNFGVARKWKRAIIDNESFWEEYILVCKECSAPIHDDLKNDLSIVRFTRCGIFNSILITISLIIYILGMYPNKAILFSAITLILGSIFAIQCYNTMKNRWIHWYTKIHKAYLETWCDKELTKKKLIKDIGEDIRDVESGLKINVHDVVSVSDGVEEVSIDDIYFPETEIINTWSQIQDAIREFLVKNNEGTKKELKYWRHMQKPLSKYFTAKRINQFNKIRSLSMEISKGNGIQISKEDARSIVNFAMKILEEINNT